MIGERRQRPVRASLKPSAEHTLELIDHRSEIFLARDGGRVTAVRSLRAQVVELADTQVSEACA